MDTLADLDPNSPHRSAGLAPGDLDDHIAAVSADLDSCGDPPGLFTTASHKDQLEQVASEQSNLIRSYITLSTPKSLRSSVLGSVQSSSSGVSNASEMVDVDPQFSSLLSPDEPLEDWCARTKRLMELQEEEEDQHRQVDALPYDPTNDPELTVPIGDPSPEDSDYEHLFSQRPSKRIRITTYRATVACDLCRKSRNKCSGGRPICERCAGRGIECHYTRGPRGIGFDGRIQSVTARALPDITHYEHESSPPRSSQEEIQSTPTRAEPDLSHYKRWQSSSSPAVSRTSSHSGDSHSEQGVESTRVGERWVHGPSRSPPSCDQVQGYRFGLENDGGEANSDSSSRSGSEDSLGLNEPFESALGLTGVYARRPSTITTVASATPSPTGGLVIALDHDYLEPPSSTATSPSGPLSPLDGMPFCDLTPQTAGNSGKPWLMPASHFYDAAQKDSRPDLRKMTGAASNASGSQNEGPLVGRISLLPISSVKPQTAVLPDGRTKGPYHATHIPLPDESSPDPQIDSCGARVGRRSGSAHRYR